MLQLLEQQFEGGIIKSIQTNVNIHIFFSFYGKFCDEKYGVSGSSLILIVTNDFMENFEKQALDTVPK
jgi:hypothetical protein